jgi:ribonuclease P protein component
MLSDELKLQSVRTFPKRLRLRKRKQFLYVQHKGIRVHTSTCFAYIVKHNEERVRLGITVSKKVGKAHQRNRIKRLMREAFRHSLLHDAHGFDIVVVAKKENPPRILSEIIETFNRFYTSAMKQSKEGKQQKERYKKHRSDTKPTSTMYKGRHAKIDSVKSGDRTQSLDHTKHTNIRHSFQSQKLDDEHNETGINRDSSIKSC